MTLRVKMLLTLVPFALVLALVGFLAVGTTNALGEGAQRILADNYRSVLAAERMKEAIERMNSAALYLIAGSTEEARSLATKSRALFEAELLVEASNITEPGEIEAVQRLKASWQRYLTIHQRLFTEAGPSLPVYLRELEPAFQAVRADTDEILTINQDAMVLKSERARRLAGTMRQVTTFAASLRCSWGSPPRSRSPTACCGRWAPCGRWCRRSGAATSPCVHLLTAATRSPIWDGPSTT